MKLEELRRLNEIEIYEVSGSEFKKYGQVIPSDDFKLIDEYMAFETTIPKEGNHYVAEYRPLMHLEEVENIRWKCFGGMDIQAGFCNGHSHKLNAMEWHNSNEINYASTDLILLLALPSDLGEEGLSLDSKKVKAFYVPKGTGVNINPRVLHFAPCAVSAEGFKCLVILPKDTNLSIPEERMVRGLFKNNKWQICHKDRQDMVDQGVNCGITGDNINIQYE